MSSTGVAHPSPLTLAECYALARTQSERLAVNRELIRETEGRFLQALSGALPRVSFNSSDKWQDGSGSSAFTLRHVPERRFAFSQPLFGGFKEFAAMAGSRAERRQRIDDLVRAEQLLLVDVANAFYLVRSVREELGVLETIRVALVQRLDELSDRRRLGRSRASEVASAEAQLRRVEAGIESTRSQETIARHLLEFLTGLDRIEALSDPEPSLSTPDPEETYLARAGARPDLRAAEEAWHIAQKQVLVEQARRWPSVSVEGNYYADRAGIAADVNWDTTLKVDVPLFQGGQAAGAVRQALARERAAKWAYLERQRSVGLDIRDAYTRLTSALAVNEAIEKSLAAAEENYRLQVEDYRLSLVSNLDVLQTLQTLEDTRRDVIRARYDAKRLYWQLQAAVGHGLSL